MTYTPTTNEYKRLTNKQFRDLARTPDGDIILLSDVSFRLTETQREKLSGDDYSRDQEYQEEMRCLMAQAKAEFE